jgi:predicted dehydrogenase
MPQPKRSRRRVTRREFLATTAASGLMVSASAQQSASAPRRIRYAIVGTGSRHQMYRDAILDTFAAHAELVGMCDLNPGRAELSRAQVQARRKVDVPVFTADRFDQMVKDTRPEVVIVTSKDATHSTYIVRAMESGCDVISEKPMTTDEVQCRAILQAQRKTGRRCTVTFNYRYSPPRSQVKDLLLSGVIGDVLSVDFHWLLDTYHGADYFRRWHSRKENSGGLLIHKATHHFDLVNWWLSGVPVSVMATGKRAFYTPEMAKRMGLTSHHERCHTCPEKERCTFALDLAANKSLKALYLDQERHDGYFRDQCVFRPEIDIEDTMNVQVRYDTGATLCYSLNAMNAWEGYFVAFNGTKGRLEHKAEESVTVSGDGNVPGALKREGTWIRIFPLRAPAYEVPIWKAEGSHGGGDAVLLQDLFQPSRPADKYLRAADQRGGACSILIGVAANHSMKSGKSVAIADLVPDLARPDYPVMPDSTSPVPMPPKRG